MARRGDMTSLAERLTIRDRAAEGATDATIARELHRSIWTIRKWRRRGQTGTMTALATRLGRPADGPLSTWPAALTAHILSLRRPHPGWGALTIRVELQRDPAWKGQRLPSRARIGALLHAAGLTRRHQHHTTLPEPDHPPNPAPHERWKLDAKGPAAVTGVGVVSVIGLAGACEQKPPVLIDRAAITPSSTAFHPIPHAHDYRPYPWVPHAWTELLHAA